MIVNEINKISDNELRLFCIEVINNLKYAPSSASNIKDEIPEVFVLTYSYEDKIDIDFFITIEDINSFISFYEKNLTFSSFSYRTNAQELADKINYLVKLMGEMIFFEKKEFCKWA